MEKNMQTNIAVFGGKEIRKTIHSNEWCFVISDVIAVLTDSIDPSGYIKDMRRDVELSKGGDKLPPSFGLKHPVGNIISTEPALKASSAS
jgi:hypothetical protein